MRSRARQIVGFPRKATPGRGRAGTIPRGLTVLLLLASVPGTAHAQVAFVQTASNSNGGNDASISATFPAAPTRGNLLIAIAGNRDSSTPATPGGWSVAISETANTPGQVIFYKIAGPSESATVTVSGYSQSTRLGLHIYEYSGLAATPLDRTASNSGSGTAVSTGTTATTSHSKELLIAGFVINTNTNFNNASWTNSFSERNDFQNGGAGGFISTYGGGTRVVSTADTYSTAATAGSSAAWRGQIATFKARRVMVVGAARPLVP